MGLTRILAPTIAGQADLCSKGAQKQSGFVAKDVRFNRVETSASCLLSLGGEKEESDTPRKAGDLMSGAASKAVTR